LLIFCLVVSAIFERKPFGGTMRKSRLRRRFALDPNDQAAIRDVCLSNPKISPDRICGYIGFRKLRFRHELMRGRGRELLRHLGVRNKNDYIAFVARLFPKAASKRFMETSKAYFHRSEGSRGASCAKDVAHLIEKASDIEFFGEDAKRSIGQGSRALFGTEYPLQEQIAIGQESRRGLLRALGSLRPKEERVLRMLFGIGCEELSAVEIAAELGRSRALVNQIAAKALRKMRHPSRLRFFADAFGCECF
jgi:RNA polymerase sigma factor (sigma-70 family)